MIVLWIILGIVGYVLGSIIFIILDVVRMTLDEYDYYDTFKRNLLSILDNNLSTDHSFCIAMGIIFFPLGIISELMTILFDFLGSTLIEKLRKWCRR